MMYMDDDALLQMAIQRSLLDSNDESAPTDQVTLYEALGHSETRVNPVDSSSRYVDYDLQR